MSEGVGQFRVQSLSWLWTDPGTAVWEENGDCFIPPWKMLHFAWKTKD